MLPLYSAAQVPPPAPQEHALPLQLSPHWEVPALPVHLCLVPTSALPWLILLEQRQGFSKTKKEEQPP